MERKREFKVLIDLEKQNRLNTEGCPACGKKFSLGDEVVLARGRWHGYKYIHQNEAVFDKHANKHYERGYYRTKKGMSP
ncbi:MAG: hypothetical protein JRI70_08340 [Deltaproteobacteria bacterium]|nr:hypothetical protein [Deltaproteobacteria bacterium]MBW2170361.1 hypothetical protein [Deltaproteobacteria bacterium]